MFDYLLRLSLCLKAALAWKHWYINKIYENKQIPGTLDLLFQNFLKIKQENCSQKQTCSNNGCHIRDTHGYYTECTDYCFPVGICTFTLTTFILFPGNWKLRSRRDKQCFKCFHLRIKLLLHSKAKLHVATSWNKQG